MNIRDIPETATSELGKALRRLLVFEQRNLWKPERLRAAAGDSQFDRRYLPESCEVFALPCFWVKRKHFYVYGNQEGCGAAPVFVEGDGAETRVLLPIHPAELERHAEFLVGVRAADATGDGLQFWATPTSSARTLLVWPSGKPELAVFVKMSLHTRLFGDRRLQRGKVASCIGLSRLVEESKCALPPGMDYFPEALGLVPRLMPYSGLIVRSIPDEIKNGSVVPAPLFALMGGDGAHRPLLLELMERNDRRVLDVLAEVLFAKFARIWVDLLLSFGIILEAHGQDLLLALSPDINPVGRLYYRDFEGLTIDWDLRCAIGLVEPVSLPHAHEWHPTYATWGYPGYQLVSWKMRTSLYDYLSLVLAELESAMREWRARRIMEAARFWRDDLTLMFSRELRRVIYERVGMKEPEDYDVHRNLNRFLMFLMRVRREVMQGGRRSG